MQHIGILIIHYLIGLRELSHLHFTVIKGHILLDTKLSSIAHQHLATVLYTHFTVRNSIPFRIKRTHIVVPTIYNIELYELLRTGQQIFERNAALRYIINQRILCPKQ